MTETEGQVVQGRVVRIRTYGAFVELPSGETGLVHISEVAEEFVRSVSDYLAEGDEVTVKVLGHNNENKLNLSIKQVRSQDVDSMRFEQQMAEVQRDLTERERHLPQIELHQVEEPVKDNPFLDWVEEARQTLHDIERKRIKKTQGGTSRQRGRRPLRRRPSR